MYKQLLDRIELIASDLKGSYNSEVPKNLSQIRHEISQIGLAIVSVTQADGLSDEQVHVLSELLNMVLHSYMDWESIKRERVWNEGITSL